MPRLSRVEYPDYFYQSITVRTLIYSAQPTTLSFHLRLYALLADEVREMHLERASVS